MDKANLKKGSLVQWAAPATQKFSQMTLFPCRMYDSETLKPKNPNPGMAAPTMLHDAPKVLTGDMFVFLQAHATKGKTWKLFSIRLNENVWVQNRHFWKYVTVLADPEEPIATPSEEDNG